MKGVRVFYNAEGGIESVMQMAATSRMTAVSAEHAFVDVSVRDAGAQTIGELHSCFRVDRHGRLARHSQRRPVVRPVRGPIEE